MATATAKQGGRTSSQHPGWICHERGKNGLDQFLDNNKPSQVKDPAIFWVHVNNPSRSPRPAVDITYVQTMWNEMTHTNSRIVPEDIKSIASATGYTSGKWLIYRKPSLVDEVWEAIARGVVEGKLGTAAKVSSRSSSQMQAGQQHVICVYTADYTDEADVLRVEAALRDLGVTGRLSYKPDIYTNCGIYYRNPWNLKATVYTTNG